MRLLLASVVVCGLITTHADEVRAVTPIRPFAGEFSEGFESFVFGGLPGLEPNQAGPFCVLGNQAKLSAKGWRPLYIWNDLGGFDLGENGLAKPFDGDRGLHLSSSPLDPTARLDFRTPVTKFGAYWVHAAYGDRRSVSVRFFDVSGEHLSTEEFTYDGALQGTSQWFGWSSDAPIGAVEFSGPYAGIDGVQIQTVGGAVASETCDDLGDPIVIDRDLRIDRTNSFEVGISIRNGLTGPTVVELVQDGEIAAKLNSASHIRDTSRLIITEGTLNGTLNVHDSASLAVSGGEFTFETGAYRDFRVGEPSDMAAIIARDQSLVDFSNAQLSAFFGSTLIALDNSRVSVSSGEINGAFGNNILLRDHSTLKLTNHAKIYNDDDAAVIAYDFSRIELTSEAEIDGNLRTYDSVVTWVRNGSLGGEVGIQLAGSSQLRLDSGHVEASDGTALAILERGIATMLDGQVLSSDSTGLSVTGDGTANISGGMVVSKDGTGARVTGKGIFNLWNGRVRGDDDPAIVAMGNGRVGIWGGEIIAEDDSAGLVVTDSSVVHLHGGDIQGDEDVDVRVADSAVLHVYGSNLVLTDSFISGSFFDGTDFSFNHDTRANGQIILHELTELRCDFDADGKCGVDDIDLLSVAIEAGANNLVFDINEDGTVSAEDLVAWRELAASGRGFAQSYLDGDANLDGKVDARDLNVIALNWQQSGNGWSDGNFVTSDNRVRFGHVNSADLASIGLNWRKSISLAPNAVSEPTASWQLLMAALLFISRRRS